MHAAKVSRKRFKTVWLNNTVNDELLQMVTHFSPVRLVAFRSNAVVMETTVMNKGSEPYWIECDVELPDAVSLAPDSKVSKGRSRLGIVHPNGVLNRSIKIYGGPGSYADTYTVRLTFYGYDSKGVIALRTERRASLRCERV